MKPITRRAIFASTVVVLLSISMGYVVADMLGGISVTQTGQNAGSIQGPADTIFQVVTPVQLTITLVQSTGVNCGEGTTWSYADTNVSVYAAGTASCTGNPNDWFEELTWTGVHVSGYGQSDTFWIYTTSSAGTNEAAFSVSDTTVLDTSGFHNGELNVFLDAGSSLDGSLPVAYTSIDIAVSGS